MLAAVSVRAQMPDLRQMNGMALPSQDLPDGAVSVRVVKQTIGNNVVGTTVTVTGDGVSDTAPTDDSGRAIFAALGPGKTAVATVTVDGETVRSQPFQVPTRGGLRVILAVGLDGAATGSTASPGVPSTGPQAPAIAATPGTVVLGTQWRTVVDFADEKLEVFHIFEFVNATAGPVSVPEPLKIGMPADAEQVTLLEGSTSQARVFERQLVVAGPFASGRTVAQVAYRLPITGPQRRIEIALPVASMATNVIVRRLGETRLAAPALPQSREADAEGKKYFTGTGPGRKAGETLTLVVEGLPYHPRWPRYTALTLAGLIVAAGLWLMFGVPVDVSGRIKQLEAQRSTLLGRLQRLERDGEPASEDLREERDAVLRDLEGVYALLDAERARANGQPQVERRAS
ncbi:hypothetical protein LuPra_03388 [Luteitalea pratensis]|uniref:Uncharacterized protein n=1 Tax=Luteitalea pratensis TaxID=1855912 RepID=A0A143PQS3_LUTPR|nr:hypothetical protein [Luteitalea pratensis]AMY10159.1 hypothetical protein LuPra_03388 [Luteitalea pratensis]